MGLIKIFKYISTSKIELITPYKLVTTEGVNQPYSFFNYIFINKKTAESIDFQNIMRHEKAHVKQGHSYDIVFIELLGIAFWCSPILYLFKRSLRNVHEYLADAAVLRATSKRQYGTLLIQQSQSGFALALANPFFSQLKKRLIMMTRNPSKRRALIKYTLAFPIFLLLVSFLASPDNKAMIVTEKVGDKLMNQVDKLIEPQAILVGDIKNIENNDEEPSPMLNSGLTGGSISYKELNETTHIIFKVKGSDKMFKTNKVQFSVRRTPANGNPVEEVLNNGVEFNDKVKALLKKAEINDEYLFRYITVERQEDSKTFEPPANLLFVYESKTKQEAPNILVSLFKKYGGGKIAINEFKELKELTLESLGSPIDGEISSFFLLRIPKDKNEVYKVTGRGNVFNENVLNLISKAQVGDTYSFMNIAYKPQNMSEAIKLGSMSFIIQPITLPAREEIEDKLKNKEYLYDIPPAQTIIDDNPVKNIFSYDKTKNQMRIYPKDTISPMEKLNAIPPDKIKELRVDNEKKCIIVIFKDGKEEVFSFTSEAWERSKNNKQDSKNTQNNDFQETPIFTMVEESPYFPQGQAALIKWLGENIKYPESARKARAEGTVYIGFVVETDGTISNVTIKRNVPVAIRDTITILETNGMKGNKIVEKTEYSLGAEAERVIKAMPKWVPGKNNGKPVRVAYTLPIKFKLE
jgi:hypothetical protein